MALALFISAMPVCSFELDLSVDEEIRRNYNPSQLELEALPPIPETKNSIPKTPSRKTSSQKSTVSSPPKNLPTTEFSSSTRMIKKTLPKTSSNSDLTAVKIKKGTKFLVKSQTGVSDSSRAGAALSFVSQQLVTQRYLTIPAGTVFKGIVLESHSPQITGNGGLIVLQVNKMIYNGSTHSINAKITKASGKKIFFNNIKGKRQYWKGVLNQIDKGQNFYDKTRNLSAKLSRNPIGTIISPIPTITGAVVYTVNFVGSPLFSIYYKGGKVSLPSGTLYEIKLLDDLYIY